MRDILFRGKRTDNGEWVYGLLCRVGDTYANIVEKSTEVMCTVLTNTIGQCTGVTDKNGNEIFEGDIVKTSHGGSTYYAKIEWDDGSFWVTNHDIQMPSYISEVSKTYLEVIGNIHDNPELLEVKG